jgi:hypothetical protein
MQIGAMEQHKNNMRYNRTLEEEDMIFIMRRNMHR